MISKEQLEELRLLEDEAARISNEIQKHRATIAADVGDEKIDITMAGVRVYWKAGRKKIDRVAAFAQYKEDGKNQLAAGARDADDFKATVNDFLHDCDALVEKHSTPREPSVSWTKIAKEAKIDLAPFTTQPAPTLTIEVQ